MAGRNRFSLVELLVVIAVISLLMTLLLPSLSLAKRSANSISCTNNLKQLGIVVSYYLGDSNDTFPSGDAAGALNDGAKVYMQLAPYIPGAVDKDGTPRIYFIDSGTKCEATSKLMVCPGSGTTNAGANYGWNPYIVSPPYTATYGTYPTLRSIRRPSTILMISDAKFHTLSFWDYTNNGTGLPSRVSLRHPGLKTNLLYVDGHVMAFGNTLGYQTIFY